MNRPIPDSRPCTCDYCRRRRRAGARVCQAAIFIGCVIGILALLVGGAMQLHSQSLPVVNRNGVKKYAPDLPFDSLNGTVNGTINAETFPGADIGAKINAAFASCSGSFASPRRSCSVVLPPGGVYTTTTPIVIPGDGVAPYVASASLDCRDSQITYTGTGAGLTVMGGNTYNSGELRNCVIIAPTVVFWSRTSFRVSNVGFYTTAATGVQFINDHAHGGPGYTEQNQWSHVELDGTGACLVTFSQDASLADGGSFFYNTFTSIHVGLNSQKAVCLSDNTGIPISLWGNTWEMTVNGGGTSTVFWIGNGASMIRGRVSLHGEAAGGYDVFASATNSIFEEFGESYVSNLAHGYGGGVPKSNIFFKGTDGFQTPYSGGIAARACKTFPDGPGIIWLANYGGNEASCTWEIRTRATDNTNQDVNIQGSGTAYQTVFFVSPCSTQGGIGIGPGYAITNGVCNTEANIPKHTLEYNGTFGSKDKKFEADANGNAHALTLRINSGPVASQPTCAVGIEGMIWYVPGSDVAQGNLWVCVNNGGSFVWTVFSNL